MAVTPEGERHLTWCAERAILELEAGSPDNALASVVSDFRKDSTTSGIELFLVVMIVEPATRQGPAKLREAIMGFNV